MSELKDFKCPNCGGRLEFDTKTQKLKCPFCEGTFDPEVFDEGSDFTITTQSWDDENVLIYSCKSCGGSIMTDKDTVATSCPYCGNPVVLTSNVTGIYKPARVIPFALDKKAAKEKFKQHLKGKKLLPKSFLSDAFIDEIKGIYVPYWLFDGKAQAMMWFDATRTRQYYQGDDICTETSYYKLFRSGSVKFADVPVDASSKIDDKLTESLEPFDLSAAKAYNDNYLAGYLADKYDLTPEETRKRADERINNSTTSLFASTTGMYDTCVPTSGNVNIQDGKQEYVMYPIWLLSAVYMGVHYTFAMNGQTGKFVGDLPYDKGSLIRHLIMVFVIVFVIATLVQYLLF